MAGKGKNSGFNLDFSLAIAQSNIQQINQLSKAVDNLAKTLGKVEKNAKGTENSIDKAVKRVKKVPLEISSTNSPNPFVPKNSLGLTGLYGESGNGPGYKPKNMNQGHYDNIRRAIAAHNQAKYEDRDTSHRSNVKEAINSHNFKNYTVLGKALKDVGILASMSSKKMREWGQESLKAHDEAGHFDVSLKKLVRTFGFYVSGYLSLRLVRASLTSLFEQSNELEELSRKNQIFFGNQKNAIDAYAQAMHNAATGKAGTSSAKDQMQAFNSLQQAGVNVNKMYGTMTNMAGKAGVQMSEVGQDINSAIFGNYEALRKYGISQRTLYSLGVYQGSPQMMKAAVLSTINNNRKLWENGAKDAANSFEGLKNRIASTWDIFKESIMGRPDDPNGLFGKIKGTFAKIANFMEKYKERLSKIGAAIGDVFKVAWSWVERMAKSIGDRLVGPNSTSAQFTEKLKDMTARFLIWMEVMRVKFTSFKWKSLEEALLRVGKAAMGIMRFAADVMSAITVKDMGINVINAALLKIGLSAAASGNWAIALACLSTAGISWGAAKVDDYMGMGKADHNKSVADFNTTVKQGMGVGYSYDQHTAAQNNKYDKDKSLYLKAHKGEVGLNDTALDKQYRYNETTGTFTKELTPAIDANTDAMKDNTEASRKLSDSWDKYFSSPGNKKLDPAQFGN